MAQTVKNLPAMQETQVRSLGGEGSLEKGMATHSSVLARESHGQRSLAGYSPWGRKELDLTEQLTLSPYCLLCDYNCSLGLSLISQSSQLSPECVGTRSPQGLPGSGGVTSGREEIKVVQY